MARIFNGVEKAFAPPTVVARQRDELLNLSGKYSDGTGPGDEPAAAASATPMQAGNSLNNAPRDIAPKLREPTPTIGGTPAASRSDPAFEPRGMTYSPEAAGKTIAGGNNRAGFMDDWFADVRKQHTRDDLIKQISNEYSNKLQGDIAHMDPEQAQDYLRGQELNGPQIGPDKDWSEVMPIYKHKAYDALPSHWPHWKREQAIRTLQGLDAEDASRFVPNASSGAFDRAMKSSRYDVDSLAKQPSRYGVDR